ncbi:prolyl oligopeptidase family serine peptidase [bacterium]|nr:prolyl oligopeptidase family serine peptidase [bacterium]
MSAKRLKEKMKIKLVFLIPLMVAMNLNAQSQKISVEHSFVNQNAEYYLFNSKEVKDTFNLYVKLPASYTSSNSTYPVFYVLDGDIAYFVACGVTPHLLLGGHIPEIIIVGIGYGSLNSGPGGKNNRMRDYSPTQIPEDQRTGKAGQFLAFLKKELIPFVDKNYRTDKKNRVIEGHSMGGLFATYVLFRETGLFNKYIISSPTVSWDNKAIFKDEETYSQNNAELKADVFISFGSDEGENFHPENVKAMITKITGRNYSELKLTTRVFDKGGHFTVPSEAMNYGLAAVFNK